MAGALDTYAKALLEDSPTYMMMAAPEEDQESCLQPPRPGRAGRPFPLEPWAFRRKMVAQAGVGGLQPAGGTDGNYTGLLVLDAYPTWFAHSHEEVQSVAVSQPVQVFRRGTSGRWSPWRIGRRWTGVYLGGTPQYRPACPDLYGSGGGISGWSFPISSC